MLLKMEEIIKQALKTKTLTQTGRGGGGCISQGEGYSTDHGVIFVKRNSDDNVSDITRS